MAHAAIIAVVLAGCYAPRVTPGVACTSACPGDQVCIDGFCRDPDSLDAAVGDATIDGAPGVDTDGDGATDDRDNCIAAANPDQHDEDADLLGDLCDPCPHVALGGATDSDSDGVGDACDPAPTSADQRWLVFDPLTSRAAEWMVFSGVTFGTDSMTFETGHARFLLVTSDVRIQIAGELEIIEPAMGHQMVVEVSHADPTHYYYGEVYSEGTAGDLKLTRRNDNAFPFLDLESYGALPQGAFAWTFDVSVTAQKLALSARHAATQFPTLHGAAPSDQPLVASPFIHVGTENIRMRVDYLALIETY